MKSVYVAELNKCPRRRCADSAFTLILGGIGWGGERASVLSFFLEKTMERWGGRRVTNSWFVAFIVELRCIMLHMTG